MILGKKSDQCSYIRTMAVHILFRIVPKENITLAIHMYLYHSWETYYHQPQLLLKYHLPHHQHLAWSSSKFPLAASYWCQNLVLKPVLWHFRTQDSDSYGLEYRTGVLKGWRVVPQQHNALGVVVVVEWVVGHAVDVLVVVVVVVEGCRVDDLSGHGSSSAEHPTTKNHKEKFNGPAKK